MFRHLNGADSAFPTRFCTCTRPNFKAHTRGPFALFEKTLWANVAHLLPINTSLFRSKMNNFMSAKVVVGLKTCDVRRGEY